MPWVGYFLGSSQYISIKMHPGITPRPLMMVELGHAYLTSFDVLRMQDRDEREIHRNALHIPSHIDGGGKHYAIQKLEHTSHFLTHIAC